MPPDMPFSIPEQWDIYHAVSNGKLLISMASTAQPIKDALDRIAGIGTSAESNMGHGKVIDTLTLKNNWMFTISPIKLVKDVLQIVAQSEPEAGMFGMLLQNSPDTHSIGIAGQNRDGGVQTNIFIALADLRDLINIVASARQMMEMQGAQQMQPMQ